jgi:hypothetical protein
MIYQSIKHTFLLIFQHLLVGDFVILLYSYYECLGIRGLRLGVFSS